MNFINMWDPNVTSDGFSGFAQRRYQVTVFLFLFLLGLLTVYITRTVHLHSQIPSLAPPWTRLHIPVLEGTIMIQVSTNVISSFSVACTYVTYSYPAASSWEMSFFAPHSVATLVQLMGGNTTFADRV